MEYFFNFMSTLFGETQPLWVKIWVGWMLIVNTLSVLFLRRKAGKVIFFVWNVVGMTMLALFIMNGYNGLLGLAHVIWWTPLMVYMYKMKNVEMESMIYKIWYKSLFITIFCSLILDYIDVIKYFIS